MWANALPVWSTNNGYIRNPLSVTIMRECLSGRNSTVPRQQTDDHEYCQALCSAGGRGGKCRRWVQERKDDNGRFIVGPNHQTNDTWNMSATSSSRKLTKTSMMLLQLSTSQILILTRSGTRSDPVVVGEGGHYVRVEVAVGDGARRAGVCQRKVHPAVDPGGVDHHPELSDVRVDGQPQQRCCRSGSAVDSAN